MLHTWMGTGINSHRWTLVFWVRTSQETAVLDDLIPTCFFAYRLPFARGVDGVSGLGGLAGCRREELGRISCQVLAGWRGGLRKGFNGGVQVLSKL